MSVGGVLNDLVKDFGVSGPRRQHNHSVISDFALRLVA